MFKDTVSLRQYISLELEVDSTLFSPHPSPQPIKYPKAADLPNRKLQKQKLRTQYANIAKIYQREQLQKQRLIQAQGMLPLCESQKLDCSQSMLDQSNQNATFHRSHKIERNFQMAEQSPENHAFDLYYKPQPTQQIIQQSGGNGEIHSSQFWRSNQKQSGRSEGDSTALTSSQINLSEREELILLLATILGMANSSIINSFLPISSHQANTYLEKNSQRITNRLIGILQCPESNKGVLFGSKNSLLSALSQIFCQRHDLKFEYQSNQANQCASFEIENENLLLGYRWKLLQQD